ncbi:MAG TPA: carbon starvation protein A [Spirochaetota bacterium]|nr:carbon starvation protein A [Spirochaetota bacterium]HPJ33434.1 carbon starvation protein A [Spirochaetota bacterium]
MDAVLIMIAVFIGYIAAYNLYGKFIGSKIFKLTNDNITPAKEFEDGMDYVPTKRGVIFGHHFTSIAGTGPIVGPAIGVIWGWVPALIWIFLGSIIMGAVHDFGALVLSLRNQGKSISDIAGKYINRRTQTVFFIIVFLELLILVAIFGMIIAIIFHMFPQSVLPVWCEIPIAIALGYAIYKKGVGVVKATVIAVFLMYVTVVMGHYLPYDMPAMWGLPATGVWSFFLFIYAFIASTLAVTTLLQPRDYINAWQLFIAMGLIVFGAIASGFTGELHIVAPAIQATPQGAPSMWPFLFITIACGAISGFHAVVSSGTSAKQVAREEDALAVGYGSMITEGFLASLVIVATAAGIGMAYQVKDGALLTGTAAWTHHYASWAASAGLGSKVSAFVIGAANMIASVGVPREIAIVIMGVFVASFAGTSLDTATRLQRYIVQEIGIRIHAKGITGKYIATLIAVISAMIVAYSTGADGKGALKLWPLFGAVNQTLAALALIVMTIYLKKKGGIKYMFTLLPALFMIIMTVWALFINQGNYLKADNMMLTSINAIVIVIAIIVAFEGFRALLFGGEAAADA